MKKIFVLIFSAVLTGGLFISCKKYKDEFYGPALGIAPEDFSISGFDVSDDMPNFASQTVYFQSTFNATVRWTIVITGEYGAIKRMEGVSSELNADNASWDGSTDTIKLFRSGENVTATLSILGWPQTYTTTLEIGAEKYRGYVLGKFDNISVNTMAKNFQDPTSYWWYYSGDGNEVSVDKIADAGTPQGEHSLRIYGVDQNMNYYVGGPGLSAPSPGRFNFGAVTLNDFYINLYVKGAGSSPEKDYKLVVQTYEDDDLNDTIYYDGSEDKYVSTISLKFDGWKLFSLKYSTFSLEDPLPSNTYRSHSPDRIANISMFIGANTAAGLSNTALIDTQIDYLTVTTNGPMKP
jgi:hypothetical protein